MLKLATVNGRKILEKRQGQGWSQEELAAKCTELHRLSPASHTPVSAKTVWRVENRAGNARERTVATIAAALGLSLHDVMLPASDASDEGPLSRAELEAISLVLRIAVAHAMASAHRVLRQPHVVGRVRTSPHKITDKPLEKDRTEPIDHATSAAIFETLQIAHKDPSHPLSKGFALFDEERGFVDAFLGHEVPSLLVFVDSCDDTRLARRGLGGTALICVYDRSSGWCCAVLGDFSRNTLYWRCLGERSLAMQLEARPDSDRTLEQHSFAFEDPRGWPIGLRSSRREILGGAALNLNVGKAGRLIATVAATRTLLSKADGEILVEAGSRGILMVAEGLADAAVEVAKGYRPLDFIPGSFIAAGVEHIAALDLGGKPLNFGPDARFEEIIDEALESGFNPRCFDELRQKFIVAATQPLGRAIQGCLKEGPS